MYMYMYNAATELNESRDESHLLLFLEFSAITNFCVAPLGRKLGRLLMWLALTWRGNLAMDPHKRVGSLLSSALGSPRPHRRVSVAVSLPRRCDLRQTYLDGADETTLRCSISVRDHTTH